MVQIFAHFAWSLAIWKYKLQNLTCKILEASNFEHAILTRGSTMVIYQYFKPLDGLTDPSGPLSASISPVAIKDANMLWEVWYKEGNVCQVHTRPPGGYSSFFKEVKMKVTSVQTWKGKYLAEGGVAMPGTYENRNKNFFQRLYTHLIWKFAPPKFPAICYLSHCTEPHTSVLNDRWRWCLLLHTVSSVTIQREDSLCPTHVTVLAWIALNPSKGRGKSLGYKAIPMLYR